MKILETSAQIDAICTPISNEIVMDDTTANTPVLFEFGLENRIYVHPTSKDNLGNYSLRIVSCVEVPAGLDSV